MEPSGTDSAAAESAGTDRVLDRLSTLATLIDRTINDVRAMDADFHDRLREAVHGTTAVLQEQAAQNLEKTISEHQRELKEQFDARIRELTQQAEEERNRLAAELATVMQASIDLETDRARLREELDQLARLQAATQSEAEKAIAALKEAHVEGAISVNSNAVTEEVQRLEGLINGISAVIDDPEVELSTVIRKNVERTQHECYLNGIRFVLNAQISK